MPGASRWIRLPLPIIVCALGAAVTVGAAIIGYGGLRMGLTLHRFRGEALPVWLSEVGFQPPRKR